MIMTKKPTRGAAPVLDDTPRSEHWLDEGNVRNIRASGTQHPTARERIETMRHPVPGPLPTKAQAFLTLCETARNFSARQTDTTFNQLADAVAVARLLKLY